MTVFMHDVIVAQLDVSFLDACHRGDTLLLASSDLHWQELLSRMGHWQLHGIELHSDESQLLRVDCRSSIRAPMGERIEPKSGIDYLGSVLTHDGRHEQGRRIGMAKAVSRPQTRHQKSFHRVQIVAQCTVSC